MAPNHDGPDTEKDDSRTESASRKITLHVKLWITNQVIPWSGLQDTHRAEGGPDHEHLEMTWWAVQSWCCTHCCGSY